MTPSLRELIEALHNAGRQCVLAVTGGGAEAAALLLTVPGASRSVLEVVVPYHERSLVEFLGHTPEQFCAPETSRALAARACERARWLAPGLPVIGLGCTASLATDRSKRGDHRLHVAVHESGQTTTYSLTLRKGIRDREGEEAVLDAVLLNALAEAFGVTGRVEVPLVAGEVLQVERQAAADPLSCFLRGEVPTVCVDVDGRVRSDAPRPGLLLPGSFNPAHQGHWLLAEVAARRTGLPAAFELSVANVDKPPLADEEVRRRIGQLAWHAPLWLTRAPTFAEKAVLFPGVVFVIGADTAVRLVAPRYYQDSAERMREALNRIRAQGCRFLVAGRADASGEFRTLDDLGLPAEFRGLFEDIPESEFHLDLSSTQLRAADNPLTHRARVWSDATEVLIMSEVKTVAEWMTERGINLAELVKASALEKRVVEAIANARYTPSPQQRQRLAAALGVEPEQVFWGHRTAVEHIYGHGPQFGRSP